MFIDLDYKKRIGKVKVHLAKPNKQVISHISEHFYGKLSLKVGDINELEFSILHFIEDKNKGLIRNEHVDLIKERMLLRVTMLDYEEWFIVVSITEDNETDDVFNVKAFSLGYELRTKSVGGINEEYINATDLLKIILEPTLWKIGYVDPVFDSMIRSFESDEDTNSLENILSMKETYGGLLKFDTVNRKISLIDIEKDGKYRGMSVDYGKFLRTITRTRTTDEMVTRLYIKGHDDLSIQEVNPTGQPYIEDFSFFMYPFERNQQRDVIKSSYFMSNELCHALLDHQALISSKSTTISSLLKDLNEKQTELVTEESKLSDLRFQLSTILELLDMAQATGNAEMIAQSKRDRNDKESEISTQSLVVGFLKNTISSINTQLDTVQNEIATESNFTPELLDELNPFIIHRRWVDDRYIDAQELYDDGIKEFNRLRTPKVVIEATIANLLEVIEEQYYWDKLVLGDLIKVKYPQMNIEYMAKIIEMNYDFDEGEVDLVIANTADLLDENEEFAQIIQSSKSATSTIQNNKYKWDKVSRIEDEVIPLITQEWDANKRKIIAGVRNSIQIGNRGIIIENPDFPNEVVIMQSGIIALSKDKGETWKTAMTPDGIIAERLIGQIIAGQNLFITNSSGTVTMDGNGFVVEASSFIVRSGTKNLADQWNSTTYFIDDFTNDEMITSYEKSRLKDEWTKIRLHYNYLNDILNNYYDDGGNNEPDVLVLRQKYNALSDYLHQENQLDNFPLLSESNIHNTTKINKNTFKTRFEEYHNQVPIVEKIISLRARELTDFAIQLANEARDLIAEIEDDSLFKVELTSTNGIMFKNNIIDTTIYARVFKGVNDITNDIPVTAFIWKKHDKDGVLDTAWGNRNINIGHTIQVNEDDVYHKATFSCDIMLEEGVKY